MFTTLGLEKLGIRKIGFGRDIQGVKAPTGLATSNITSTSITLTWDNDESIDHWEVYLDGNLVDDTVATNSYEFTGLTTSTEYILGVIAVKGSTKSLISTMSGLTTGEYYNIDTLGNLLSTSHLRFVAEDKSETELVTMQGSGTTNDGFLKKFSLNTTNKTWTEDASVTRSNIYSSGLFKLFDTRWNENVFGAIMSQGLGTGGTSSLMYRWTTAFSALTSSSFINDNNYGNTYPFARPLMLSNNLGLLHFQYGSGTAPGNQCYVRSVSPSSTTSYTGGNFSISNNNYQGVWIARVSDTKYIILRRDSANSYHLYATIVGISGTTHTSLSSAKILEEVINTVYCVQIADDKILTVYRTSTGDEKIRILTISNDTVSAISDAYNITGLVNGGIGASYNSQIKKFRDGSVILACRYGAILIKYSGTNILGATLLSNSGQFYDTVKLSDTKALILFPTGQEIRTHLIEYSSTEKPEKILSNYWTDSDSNYATVGSANVTSYTPFEVTETINVRDILVRAMYTNNSGTIPFKAWGAGADSGNFVYLTITDNSNNILSDNIGKLEVYNDYRYPAQSTRYNIKISVNPVTLTPGNYKICVRRIHATSVGSIFFNTRTWDQLTTLSFKLIGN